jgi:PAS domain S-box-containing protein
VAALKACEWEMSVPQLLPTPQDLVQETLLGEAIEHAPVGAIVLDEDGRYLAANRLACELSGYTRDELLAGGAQALTPTPERMSETLDRMASGELQGGVAEMVCKDGTSVTCEFRVGATRSGGLPFHVLVFWETQDSE